MPRLQGPEHVAEVQRPAARVALDLPELAEHDRLKGGFVPAGEADPQRYDLAALTEREATSDRMPAVIARWVKSKRADWSESTRKQRDLYAAKMAEAFAFYFN